MVFRIRVYLYHNPVKTFFFETFFGTADNRRLTLM